MDQHTKDLVESGAICIAYETVTSPHGGLPLLAPMSQVAGRMSIQAGATALEANNGGAGLLLGGVPGVEDHGEAQANVVEAIPSLVIREDGVIPTQPGEARSVAVADGPGESRLGGRGVLLASPFVVRGGNEANPCLWDGLTLRVAHDT